MPYVVLRSAPSLLGDDEILKAAQSDTVIGDVIAQDDVTSRVFQRVSFENQYVQDTLDGRLIASDIEESLTEHLSVLQQYQRLTEMMMRHLSPADEFCLRAYHHCVDGEHICFQQIADRLGVTRQRVGQRISRAKEKMNDPVIKNYIENGPILNGSPHI